MSNPFVEEMRLRQAERCCREMIIMTDEMSRRVGLDQSIGRELLLIEDKFSAQANRKLNMAAVARSIKATAERLKTR